MVINNKNILDSMYTNFIDFCLNEGAYLDQDGSIILNGSDDPNNNDEVLKTESGRIMASTYNSKAEWNNPLKQRLLKFPIYYSLGIDDYDGQIDHEGRFKYTMDQLKDGNIKGGDQAIEEFLEYSFNQLKLKKSMSGVKYVISVGSSKGLVASLSNAAANIFNANVIHLPKVEYINVGHAINFEELKHQVETQEKGESMFETFKNFIVREYVNTDQSDPEIVDAIRNARDIEDLKKLLLRQNRYLSDADLIWNNEDEFRTQLRPFIVKSSGVDFRGLNTRRMWKPKYDYNYTEFMDAVAECATKYGTKMLIIDDNRNSGTDITNITNNIIQISESLKLDRNLAKDWMTNFAFYVMYNMRKTNKDFEYTDPEGKKAKNIALNNRAAQSFEEFAGLR